MLDKTIISHIDVMDGIETEMQADIDKIMSKIDVDVLIESPEKELTEFMDLVKGIILSKYTEQALAEGVKVAKLVEKFRKQDKEIVIPDSENPHLNKEKVDV